MGLRTPVEFYEQRRRDTLEKALKEATYLRLSDGEDVLAIEAMLDELVSELESIEESLHITRQAESRRNNGHHTNGKVTPLAT